MVKEITELIYVAVNCIILSILAYSSFVICIILKIQCGDQNSFFFHLLGLYEF